MARQIKKPSRNLLKFKLTVVLKVFLSIINSMLTSLLIVITTGKLFGFSSMQQTILTSLKIFPPVLLMHFFLITYYIIEYTQELNSKGEYKW